MNQTEQIKIKTLFWFSSRWLHEIIWKYVCTSSSINLTVYLTLLFNMLYNIITCHTKMSNNKTYTKFKHFHISPPANKAAIISRQIQVKFQAPTGFSPCYCCCKWWAKELKHVARPLKALWQENFNRKF